MKDTITNGSGNSRFLKSNIPSTTTFAQFLAMLNAGTFPFDFNGINSAGVKQMGDALSKANLLTDETAAALGLDPEDNPQVNDALARGAYSFANRYLIGDTRTTVRTDLSKNWALCNGATVYRDNGTNAELYALLDPGFKERKRPTELGMSTIVQMANGMWNDCGSGGSGKSVVINPYTGERTEISTKTNGLLGSYIIGVTWNGNEYVCCTIYNGSYLVFYKSSDLITWTEAARHQPEHAPAYSPTYGDMRFLWDGAAYRVACQWSGYQAQDLNTYDAAFNYLGRIDCTDEAIYAADGLFCVGCSYDASLYEPGSTARLYPAYSVSTEEGLVVYEKYASNKYVLVPRSYVRFIAFYDKSSNTATRKSVYDFFGYTIPEGGTSSIYPYWCRDVFPDYKTNELVFYLSDTDATNFVEARISFNADFTVKENYKFKVMPAVTEKPYLLKYGNEWTKMSTTKMRGSHPRVLPTITHDDVYTYIKIEEGE